MKNKNWQKGKELEGKENDYKAKVCVAEGRIIQNQYKRNDHNEHLNPKTQFVDHTKCCYVWSLYLRQSIFSITYLNFLKEIGYRVQSEFALKQHVVFLILKTVNKS